MSHHKRTAPRNRDCGLNTKDRDATDESDGLPSVGKILPVILKGIELLKDTEKRWTEGDYLNFRDEGFVTPGSKTRKFSVISRHSNALLGFVKWYVPWRQYVLFPINAVFDKKCLREIADFCERETAAHREKRKV